MPTRVFDGINRIIEMLTAAGANVVDGPLVDGDTATKIFVGFDADPEGDWSTAVIEQDWSGIGSSRKRDEQFDIVGAVVCAYSADNMKTLRARVQEQFTLVESTILADPSLSLPGQVDYCVAGVHPVQLFAESGQYRLTFVIRVKTRV
jgi:hypothetical protein